MARRLFVARAAKSRTTRRKTLQQKRDSGRSGCACDFPRRHDNSRARKMRTKKLTLIHGRHNGAEIMYVGGDFVGDPLVGEKDGGECTDEPEKQARRDQ